MRFINLKNRLFCNNSFGAVNLLIFIFLTVSLITRTALLAYSFDEVNLSVPELFKAFAVGAFYDLVAAAYFVLPLVLYTVLAP